MNRILFKQFKERLEEATDPQDPLYYSGFLWISLTDNQVNDILPILEKHPCFKRGLKIDENGERFYFYNETGLVIFDDRKKVAQ